ncbi:tail assembly chaperone gp38 [Escherichia coli]|nr:tail assembly chaperone gp38 [Escherichia coli]
MGIKMKITVLNTVGFFMDGCGVIPQILRNNGRTLAVIIKISS